jgi:DNA end-binding protein Ku
MGTGIGTGAARASLMARPMWKGSLSFGLVQIPVGLHTAEGNPETDLSFTLLDKKDHSPVGYKHVNKVTGEEVPKERRIKGFEVEKGKYVILTEDDFKRANVKATETVDILGFVEPEEIPVTRFEKPYYVVPEKRGLKAYVLLRDALVSANKVGIATVVLRQRQHVCAVVPVDDMLVLEILRYGEEIREAPAMEDELPRVSDAELEMAMRLIEGMETTFDEIKVEDKYHEDLMHIIEERAENPEAIPEPLPKEKKPRGEVVDIMSLLKKSVEGRATQPEGEERAPRERKPKRATRKGNGHKKARG